MNDPTVLGCTLVYGFETLSADAAVRLLELILGISLDRHDRPDQGGVVYEYRPTEEPELGRLVQVLLTPNHVEGFGWKHGDARQCSYVAEIYWRTTDLLEPGRLAGEVESYGDVRIHLLSYEVFGDFAGDGRQLQIRRSFTGLLPAEARWKAPHGRSASGREKIDPKS